MVIAGLIGLIALMAAAPATGCADHWNIGVSRDSFENNGAGVTFAPADLDDFEDRIAQTVKRAINQACNDGIVAPELAASVSSVFVMSASGASEPHFYRAYDDVIAFEWIFAEEGLRLPSDEEIIVGVSCWTEPDGPACVAMENGD